MGKLTDVELRNWIKAGKPVAKSDGQGLTFTLSAKGTAAWTLRYFFGGKGNYTPDPAILRRCESYGPLPNDPDQRRGWDRWPGLNLFSQR